MVTKMNATPSIARDTMRMVPLPAKAPISEPIATTTAAASSIVFGPNFLASAPVAGPMMPTKVKIDMSHEVVDLCVHVHLHHDIAHDDGDLVLNRCDGRAEQQHGDGYAPTRVFLFLGS